MGCFRVWGLATQQARAHHDVLLEFGDLVKQGMLRFDAGSLARNIRRLRDCMRVVAARTDKDVRYTREVYDNEEGRWVEKEMFARGTYGAFPPKTIA